MKYAAATNGGAITFFFSEYQNGRTPLERAKDYAQRARAAGNTVKIYHERQGYRFMKDGQDVFPRWVETSI